jgi:hypothetical protein
VGGSDTHHLINPTGDHLGRPTTWVLAGATRSVERILTALREGRSFVSRDTDGPQLYVSRQSIHVVDGRGATLTVVSPRGVESTSTVPTDDWTTSVTVDAPYVRVQLSAHNEEMLAVSNPVWSE